MTDMNVNFDTHSSNSALEKDKASPASSLADEESTRPMEDKKDAFLETKMSIDVENFNDNESTISSKPPQTVTPLLLLPNEENVNVENDDEEHASLRSSSFLNKRAMFTSESSQNSVESSDFNASFDELKKSLALIEVIDPCEMDLLIKTIKNMFPKVKIHLCNKEDGKTSPTPSLSVKSNSPSPSPSANHLTTSPVGSHPFAPNGAGPLKQTNLSAGYKMTDYRPSSIDNSSLLSSIDRQESKDSGFWSMSKCSFESMKSLSISDSNPTEAALNGLFKFSNNHNMANFMANLANNNNANNNNTASTNMHNGVDLSSPSASTSPSGQKAGDVSAEGSASSSQKYLAASAAAAAAGKPMGNFKKWKIGQAWRYNSSSSNLSEADSINQSIMSNKIEENNSSEDLVQKSFDGELLSTSSSHANPKMNELSSNYPLSYRKSFDSVLSASTTTAPLSTKLAGSASTISPTGETPHSQSLQQIWSSTSRLNFQFNKNYHDDLSLNEKNSFKAQKRRGKLMRDRTIDNADEQSSVLAFVNSKNNEIKSNNSNNNSQSRSTTSPGLTNNDIQKNSNNSSPSNANASSNNSNGSSSNSSSNEEKYTFAAIQNHPTSSVGYANLNRSASPSFSRDAKPSELATSLGSNLNGRISPPEKRVSLSFDQYDMGGSMEMRRDDEHLEKFSDEKIETRKSNPHLSNFSVKNLINSNNSSTESAPGYCFSSGQSMGSNSSLNQMPKQFLSSDAQSRTSPDVQAIVNGLNFNQKMSLSDQKSQESLNSSALLYQYEVYKDLQAKLNLKSNDFDEPSKFPPMSSRNFNLLSPANFSKLAHAAKKSGRISPSHQLSPASSSDLMRSRKKIGHQHHFGSRSKESGSGEGQQSHSPGKSLDHALSNEKLASLIAQQEQLAINKSPKHGNSSSFDFHQASSEDQAAADCNLSTNSIMNKSMFRSNSSPSYSSLSSASPTPSSSPSLQYSQPASAGNASPLPKYPESQDSSKGNEATSSKPTQDNAVAAAAAAVVAAAVAGSNGFNQILSQGGISIPPKYQFKSTLHESFGLSKSQFEEAKLNAKQFSAILKPPEIVITESKSDNLIDYDVEPGYSNDTDRSTNEIKDHKNDHPVIPDSQHSKQMMFKGSQSQSNPIAPSHQTQFFKNLSGAFDSLLFKDKIGNNQENFFSLWKSNLASSVDQFNKNNADPAGNKVLNGSSHMGGPSNGFNANKNFLFNFDSLSNSLNKNLSGMSGGGSSGVMKSGSRNLKPHVCMSCQKRFARSDMLIRHSRLHSGIRPYRCNRCGQEFSRSDHLNTHLRTHTGEKPYSCPHCSYAACRKDMITRHLKVHNKNRLSLSFDGGEKSNNEMLSGNSASSAVSLSSLTPKLPYQTSLSSFSSSHMLDSIASFNANLSNGATNGHMPFSVLPNVSAAPDSRLFTPDLRKLDIKSKSTCSLSTL